MTKIDERFVDLYDQMIDNVITRIGTENGAILDGHVASENKKSLLKNEDCRQAFIEFVNIVRKKNSDFYSHIL